MSCCPSWRTNESRYITNDLLYCSILNLIIHTDRGKYCLLTSFFISEKFSLGIVFIMVFTKLCCIIEISVFSGISTFTAFWYPLVCYLHHFGQVFRDTVFILLFYWGLAIPVLLFFNTVLFYIIDAEVFLNI